MTTTTKEALAEALAAIRKRWNRLTDQSIGEAQNTMDMLLDALENTMDMLLDSLDAAEDRAEQAEAYAAKLNAALDQEQDRAEQAEAERDVLAHALAERDGQTVEIALLWAEQVAKRGEEGKE